MKTLALALLLAIPAIAQSEPTKVSVQVMKQTHSSVKSDDGKNSGQRTTMLAKTATSWMIVYCNDWDRPAFGSCPTLEIGKVYELKRQMVNGFDILTFNQGLTSLFVRSEIALELVSISCALKENALACVENLLESK